ncbi:SDR family oxidoreductase [Priestia megaterium]|nr:SDR family oxidoreductase [Priestia megaterium]
MNIALLGATGRVGQLLLDLMLQDEHNVTVLVRNPQKLEMKHPNLTIVQGNVLKQEDLNQTIQGQDVVVSTLNTDGSATISESMPLLITSMKKYHVKRIITIGTAGILQSRVEPTLYRFQSSESKRRSTRAAEDHLKGYLSLKESSLDWTIVCPTYLPDGKITGRYRVEENMLPANAVKISTGDTAHFTYRELRSANFSYCRIGLGY